jgi:thiamine biosynthesis lipoprotein
MGTIVSIEVLGAESDPEITAREQAIERAFGWFEAVEKHCNRFDPASELRRLTASQLEPGAGPTSVSDLLYSAVSFAIEVARETGGAFDPAVGQAMEARGFTRNYRTGISEPADLPNSQNLPTFRDVVLDDERKTVKFLRPMILDLGAVAKGFAIDLAARELVEFRDFAIDAGGDLYLSGQNERGRPWTAGIRHPRSDREVIAAVDVSDRAICSSGDYERRDVLGGHIIDPRTVGAANAVASATVIASGAFVADALATAAFVLGPVEGIRMLERQGVEGILFTPELRGYATAGYEALLSDT